MDKKDADAINAGFNQLTAENFALKRMLAMLFASAPDAMERLRNADDDAQWTTDWLEGQPFDDVFIARVLETLKAVRRTAEVALGHPRSGSPG